MCSWPNAIAQEIDRNMPSTPKMVWMAAFCTKVLSIKLRCLSSAKLAHSNHRKGNLIREPIRSGAVPIAPEWHRLPFDCEGGLGGCRNRTWHCQSEDGVCTLNNQKGAKSFRQKAPNAAGCTCWEHDHMYSRIAKCIKMRFSQATNLSGGDHGDVLYIG